MQTSHLVEMFHLPAHLYGLLGQNVDVTLDYQHYLTTTLLKLESCYCMILHSKCEYQYTEHVCHIAA